MTVGMGFVIVRYRGGGNFGILLYNAIIFFFILYFRIPELSDNDIALFSMYSFLYRLF